MAMDRREFKMTLRILITVMTAILDVLEKAENTPKEALTAGKDGVR